MIAAANSELWARIPPNSRSRSGAAGYQRAGPLEAFESVDITPLSRLVGDQNVVAAVVTLTKIDRAVVGATGAEMPLEPAFCAAQPFRWQGLRPGGGGSWSATGRYGGTAYGGTAYHGAYYGGAYGGYHGGYYGGTTVVTPGYTGAGVAAGAVAGWQSAPPLPLRPMQQRAPTTIRRPITSHLRGSGCPRVGTPAAWRGPASGE
jgi:hypothetical protein